MGIVPPSPSSEDRHSDEQVRVQFSCNIHLGSPWENLQEGEVVKVEKFESERRFSVAVLCVMTVRQC
jgi:hypothetical protein